MPSPERAPGADDLCALLGGSGRAGRWFWEDLCISLGLRGRIWKCWLVSSGT